MIRSFTCETKEICKILNLPKLKTDYTVSGITWSSKDKGTSHCFVCIKGRNYDGGDYIEEAIENGASLIIGEKNYNISVPYLRIKNARDALCQIAKYNLDRSGAKVIGITGSVGKTTVKEMISSVLSVKYKVICTKENENNEIGVAKTLLSVTNEDFCVVEMGMRGFGEISYLSEICHPETSVITNCGSAHIGRLGSKENIFKAKTEIIEYTERNCIIPYEKRFEELDKKKCKAVYIGSNGDLCAKKIKILDKYIRYDIFLNGKCMGEIKIPSYAMYNVSNSLNAYAVGNLYGLSHKEIQYGLERYKNTGLRENVIYINGIMIFLECYNASYEGMKSTIGSFIDYCNVCQRTPFLLLGDMKENGGLEKEYHYRIGEYARDKGVKDIFVYGENAKSYTDGFCGGEMFKNFRIMAEFILNNCGSSDALLIKGSRSEHLEYTVNEMKEILK